MKWFKKKKVKLGNVTAATGTGKRAGNWQSVSGQTGTDYEPDKMSRAKLRRKAFGLRYNPYVVRYLSVMESLMLGKEGFVLDFKQDTQTTRRLERDFKKWQKSVSVCGRYNLRSMFATIVTDHLLGGELFLEKIIEDGRLGYRIHQVIDESQGQGNERVVDGIGYDLYNRPVSYRLVTDGVRPNNSYAPLNFTTVNADRMIHVYSAKLAGDYRGTTALAPVIGLLEKLHKFTDSILDQQIISSATSTVYQKTTDDAEAFNQFDQDDDGSPSQIKEGEFKKTLNSKEVLVVPAGYELNHSDFSNVSPSNSNYVSDVLKRISAGLLIPYHALSGDLSGANFSSLKFNSLLEDSHFQSMQTLYACVYREIVIDYIKHKSLTDKFFDVEQMIDNIVVHPYKMPPLEPLKKAQVDELNLDLGLVTKTQILAENGLVYEDILKDKQKEKKVKDLYT